MAKIVITVPDGASAGRRLSTDERPQGLMPTRIHGQKTRRTARRKEREKARAHGWAE